MPLAARRVIDDYLRALSSRGASRSTLRQRAWALGNVLRVAAELTQTPEAQLPLTALLTASQEAVTLLSHDSSIPTQRAYHAALTALAGFAEAGQPLPRIPAPPPREVVAADALPALDALRRGQVSGLSPEQQARLSAVLALLATASLSGTQLCGLRTTDFDDTLRTMFPPPAPLRGRRLRLIAGDSSPSPAITPPPAAPVLLPDFARASVAAWMNVRATIVRPLAGGYVEALLISLHHNHSATGSVRPAGVPLQPRGLQRAFAAAVAKANAQFLGRPGFPLPRSLDLARRSYAAARPPGTSAPDLR